MGQHHIFEVKTAEMSGLAEHSTLELVDVHGSSDSDQIALLSNDYAGKGRQVFVTVFISNICVNDLIYR